MKITGSGNRVTLTINGKRCGVRVCAGPWVSAHLADMIQVTPKQYSFPSEFRGVLAVLNNSDSREDYFECDKIRLFPGHPLYAAAKAIASN